MSRRSTHVEILDWGAILRPTRGRPEKEKLFESELTLKNVSLRKTKIAFKIQGRQDLSMQNQILDIRRVLGNRLNHRIAKFFTLLIPVSLLQVVWGVLHEARHHVFAPWRHGRIRQTGNDHVDVRTTREAGLSSFVICALHVVNAW